MQPKQLTELSEPILRIADFGQHTPVRHSSLLASAAVHVLFCAMIFSVAAPENVHHAVHAVMPLFAPAPPPKRFLAEPARMATRPLIAPASQPLAIQPRISAPVPRPQPLPEAPALQPDATSKLPHASADVPAIEAPRLAPQKTPVTTGVFTAGDPPAVSPAGSSKPTVQTGTFSPGGVPVNRPETASGRAQVGGFEASRAVVNQPKTSPTPAAAAGFDGPGGAPRSGSVAAPPVTGAFGETVAARTKVRSTVIQSAAGFGSTVATTSPSPKQRETTSAQFESVAVNLAPTPSAAKDGRGERYKPVEILRKPRPVYSQEARRLQLEGEVNLEAVFTSSGKVLVKRVLHGLGHGLDENAVQAANTIQFHPASINGIPIDVAGVVKITFQLAY